MVKKRIFAAILLAVIAVGGTGCMAFRTKEPTGSKAKTNELALSYMEEKYGEPFTYAAPWGSSMTGTREFLATCASLPGQPVLVRAEQFREEEPVYGDNFLAVKYQAETTEYLGGLAAEIFGEANVYHEASKQSVSSQLPADASFETFYSDSSTVIIATIEIKGSSYSSRQQLEELFSKMEAGQGQIMVSVIVVEDSVYGTLSRRDLDHLVYRKEEIAFAHAETQAGTFLITWPEED